MAERFEIAGRQGESFLELLACLTALALHRQADAEDVRAARLLRDRRDQLSRHIGGLRHVYEYTFNYRNMPIDEFLVANGAKLRVNDAVVELIHRHGVGTLRPDPRNLEPLLEALPR